MTKMVEIIEQVGGERMARRADAGFKGPGYYKHNSQGRLVEDLDSHGNDTEYDSMDLMVGVHMGGTGRVGTSHVSDKVDGTYAVLWERRGRMIESSLRRQTPPPSYLLPQVGNTTDGGFGPGWIQNTRINCPLTPSHLPPSIRLATPRMAVSAPAGSRTLRMTICTSTTPSSSRASRATWPRTSWRRARIRRPSWGTTC